MNTTEFLSGFDVGDIVPIFLSAESEEELLGYGKILEFIADVDEKLCFIRQEMPTHKQEVWAPRKARLELQEITTLGESFNLSEGKIIRKKIGIPYRIGVASSSALAKYTFSSSYNKYILDNFELIPGWGQCF